MNDKEASPGPGEATTAIHAPDQAGHPANRLALGVWAVLALALLVLFWDTSGSFVATWSQSNTFGHGFLIIPICLYLVWTRRAILAAIGPRPNPWALAIFAGALATWLAGNLTDTVLAKQLGLVLMVQGSFLLVLGTRLAKAAAFPLAYLFFAVPFGESAIPPLQDLTASFVVNILRATGMPVYLEGVFIQIPSGRFLVAEACAGVRYLLTSVALGVLMSALFYRTWWRKALIIALSVVVPIVANGIRAYGIIMVAHLTDYEVAVGVDHVLYGLVFLGFVTLCLLALGMTFREHDASSQSPSPQSGGTLRSPTAVVLTSLAALALATSARGYDAYMADRMQSAPPVQTPRLTVSAPWAEAEEPITDWRPIIPGADARSAQTFVGDGRSATVVIALFARQRPGAETITWRNDVAGSDLWSISSLGRSRIRIDGQEVDVAKATLIGPRRGRVVWFWYWVDGRFTANPYWAKLLEVRAKLFGGSQSAAVIALSMKAEESSVPAETRLEPFLDHLSPLGAALEAASRGAAPTAVTPGESS